MDGPSEERENRQKVNFQCRAERPVPPVTIAGCEPAGNVVAAPDLSGSTFAAAARSTSGRATPGLPWKFAAPLARARSRKLGAHNRSTPGQRLQLTESGRAGEVLHAAVRRRDQPLNRHVFEAVPDALRDLLGRLDRRRAEVEDAEDNGLARDRPAARRDRAPGSAASIEIWSAALVGERLEEGVAAPALVLDELRVAEAEVDRGRPRHALERPIDRLSRA